MCICDVNFIPSNLCNVLCTTTWQCAAKYNYAHLQLCNCMMCFEQCTILHNATFNSNMSIEKCVKYNYAGCEIVQLVQLTHCNLWTRRSAEGKVRTAHCVQYSTMILCNWHIVFYERGAKGKVYTVKCNNTVQLTHCFSWGRRRGKVYTTQCVQYSTNILCNWHIVFYEGGAEWKAKVWQGDIILCLLAIMDIGVGINI